VGGAGALNEPGGRPAGSEDATRVAQTNVETIRKGLEAFNRADIAALMETCHPDAEFVPLRAVLEGVTYRGEEGLRKFFAETSEEWSRLRIEAQEFQHAGDRVLLLGRFQARGRASGVEVDVPAAWVFEMRDGRVARLQAYTDQAEARAAAGLRE
jgi:ketosteroid isomerase-like protein